MSRALALLALSLSCASCGDDAANAGAFIALQEHFAPYRTWASVDLGVRGLVGHPTGRSIVYANGPVPEGCAWPLGAILVKEIRVTDDPRTWEIFALVKRGGSFDANPAAGWEFFTLGLATNGTPVITGRGINPGTDSYTGGSGGGCNGCHGSTAARPFDSVLTVALRPRCPTR